MSYEQHSDDVRLTAAVNGQVLDELAVPRLPFADENDTTEHHDNTAAVLPSGAINLMSLFDPPGVPAPVHNSNNHSSSNIKQQSAAVTQPNNNNLLHNTQQLPLPPLRARTPSPPPPPPNGDSCPSTPSGLTWRKAGSTFNLYPSTLISRHNSDRRLLRLEQLESLPRLVKRNQPFYQSSNKIYVKHNQGTKIYALLRFNWFHVFLRWPTKYSLTLLLSVWTATILFFAGLYLVYDANNDAAPCALGGVLDDYGGLESNIPKMHFSTAFAFSLETCTTVGYGLPNGINAFFEQGCGGLQLIIYFQMAWSMIFNAFLITFIYNRLGRSEARSIQVLFSNKALVSIVDDQVRFQVRLFDCDTKHPVVEAHVRMYCVMKQRPVPRPLRILQPDDDLGAMLFLSFPSVVSHNIDMYSLLHPPVASFLMKPKGLVLRQVDGQTNNRDDIICPVCGESYGTFDRWLNHVRYQQIAEEKDDFPVNGTHLSLDMNEIEKEPYTKPIQDIESLKQYFRNNVSEILCLVEGIDPMQSGTFQALQSYRFEDIEWESYAQFSPCLTVAAVRKEEIFVVDLDRYHAVVPDPEAAEAAKQAQEEEQQFHYMLRTPSGSTKHKDGKPVRKRQRHRRLKTLSSGISDSLFAKPVQGPLVAAATGVVGLTDVQQL